MFSWAGRSCLMFFTVTAWGQISLVVRMSMCLRACPFLIICQLGPDGFVSVFDNKTSFSWNIMKFLNLEGHQISTNDLRVTTILRKKSFFFTINYSKCFCTPTFKNPAYGRQRISPNMRILAPILFLVFAAAAKETFCLMPSLSPSPHFFFSPQSPPPSASPSLYAKKINIYIKNLPSPPPFLLWEGGEEGGLTNERPWTDHVIRGPMRGLKKNCNGRGQTNKSINK